MRTHRRHNVIFTKDKWIHKSLLRPTQMCVCDVVREWLVMHTRTGDQFEWQKSWDQFKIPFNQYAIGKSKMTTEERERETHTHVNQSNEWYHKKMQKGQWNATDMRTRLHKFYGQKGSEQVIKWTKNTHSLEEFGAKINWKHHRKRRTNLSHRLHSNLRDCVICEEQYVEHIIVITTNICVCVCACLSFSHMNTVSHLKWTTSWSHQLIIAIKSCVLLAIIGRTRIHMVCWWKVYF